LYQLTHKAIAGITHDIETKFQFNTVISKIRELANALGKLGPALQSGCSETGCEPVLGEAVKILLQLMAPVVPHISEELWRQLGQTTSIHQSAWPVADAQALVADTVEMVVQVNGKLRDRFVQASGTPEAETLAKAMTCPKVQESLVGKQLVKTIVVPNKLVNLVVQ
jgi:leucyl-tRNA synthetase